MRLSYYVIISFTFLFTSYITNNKFYIVSKKVIATLATVSLPELHVNAQAGSATKPHV